MSLTQNGSEWMVKDTPSIYSTEKGHLGNADSLTPLTAIPSLSQIEMSHLWNCYGLNARLSNTEVCLLWHGQAFNITPAIYLGCMKLNLVIRVVDLLSIIGTSKLNNAGLFRDDCQLLVIPIVCIHVVLYDVLGIIGYVAQQNVLLP
jgi:hypothetical protein